MLLCLAIEALVDRGDMRVDLLSRVMYKVPYEILNI